MSDMRPTVPMPEDGSPQDVAKWLTGGLAGWTLVQTTLAGKPVDLLMTHVGFHEEMGTCGWVPVAILVDDQFVDTLGIPYQMPACPHD